MQREQTIGQPCAGNQPARAREGTAPEVYQ